MSKNAPLQANIVTYSLLRARTDHIGVQLFRYLCVGALGFITDYSSLYLLTEFAGLYYLFSAPVAFLLGLLVHYTLSVKWVFSRRNLSNRYAEMCIYMGLGGAGLLLNELVIWSCTEFFHLHYMISKLFYLFIFILLFGLRKALLFR
ncbi:MAG: GtrA family protein [Desulfohalobiaceae bacterium]